MIQVFWCFLMYCIYEVSAWAIHTYRASLYQLLLLQSSLFQTPYIVILSELGKGRHVYMYA